MVSKRRASMDCPCKYLVEVAKRRLSQPVPPGRLTMRLRQQDGYPSFAVFPGRLFVVAAKPDRHEPQSRSPQRGNAHQVS